MIVESGEAEQFGEISAEAMPPKTDDAEADEDGHEEDSGHMMQASHQSIESHMYQYIWLLVQCLLRTSQSQ